MTALTMHYGIQFGLAGVLDKLRGAGFREASQLEQRLLVIGFVRAVKS